MADNRNGIQNTHPQNLRALNPTPNGQQNRGAANLPALKKVGEGNARGLANPPNQAQQGNQADKGNQALQANLPGAHDINAQGPLQANEAQAVNDAAFGVTRENYQKDMDANPDLIQALAAANMHPSPDGLVRVEQAKNKDPDGWNKVVDAAHTVALMGGKSPGANDTLAKAMNAFAKSTGLRPADSGDLAYMLARVMMKDDETNRDDSVKRLQAALEAAKQQLKQLEQQRNDPNRNQTQAVSGDSGGGGKKDDGGGNNQAQMAVAQNEQINAQNRQMDAQIENQKKLVNDIQAKIDAGGAAGDKKGQTNQELITEAILAMVEHAHAMAQLNGAAGEGQQRQVGAPQGQQQNGQQKNGGGAKP